MALRDRSQSFSLKSLFWLSLFAIAMAYLEAAVVVYLRALYYPDGFAFPLKMIPFQILAVEIGREAATIVMLVTMGVIAGRNFGQRFSCFIFSFGVWDIFYYIWLKVLCNWPDSLLEWDILFLIPVTWTGPVLAPVIISLSMIVAAILILHLAARGVEFKLNLLEWGLEFLAAAGIFVSFVLDCKNIMNGGLPNPFRWEIFLGGELLGIIVFVQRYVKILRTMKK